MKRLSSILIPFNGAEAIMLIIVAVGFAVVGKDAVMAGQALAGAYIIAVVMTALGVDPGYRLVRTKSK